MSSLWKVLEVKLEEDFRYSPRTFNLFHLVPSCFLFSVRPILSRCTFLLCSSWRERRDIFSAYRSISYTSYTIWLTTVFCWIKIVPVIIPCCLLIYKSSVSPTTMFMFGFVGIVYPSWTYLFSIMPTLTVG